MFLEFVSPREYEISFDSPDDMVSLYKRLVRSKGVPIVITTDFILHIFHKLYDEYLITLEQKQFIPDLREFLKQLVVNIQKLRQTTKHKSLKEQLRRTEAYLCVAGKLVSFGKICSVDVSTQIETELTKINTARGVGWSVLQQVAHDYSQYIPRSHYTLNNDLKGFFKAMMWLGRFRFVARKDPDFLSALVLTKQITENKNLLSLWSSLFDPINLMVGRADDMTIRTIDKILGAQLKAVPYEALGDPKKLHALQERMLAKMPRPKVAGDPSPPGLCLFAQRFTVDAMFYTLLTAPRIGGRTIPTVLDTATCLGSNEGEALLQAQIKKYGMKNALAKCKKYITTLTTEDWLANVYQGVLGAGRTLLTFPQNTGFPWIDSELYRRKNMLAFHGVYAELKRDTILYAKQAGLEIGGCRPPREYDYKRDPIPEPPSYVEPNVPFFAWMKAVSSLLRATAKESDGLGERIVRKLRYFNGHMDKLQTLARKEAAYQPLLSNDFSYLNSLPSMMARILQPKGNRLSREGKENAKIPIVSDIYTDARRGRVLEVGTGIPYRIYMAVEGPGGGKRIVVGYTYSYYEFTAGMAARMTDQRWRRQVYNQKKRPDPSLEKRQPAWEKSLILR